MLLEMSKPNNTIKRGPCHRRPLDSNFETAPSRAPITKSKKHRKRNHSQTNSSSRKPTKTTMKSMVSTPNSSTKSSTTASATATSWSSSASTESEARDNSAYFPGCRKDANCTCEMCLESMNATLDLMPQSIHRSSITNFSVSKPSFPRSPIKFNPCAFSTPEPKPRIQTNKMSPPLDSKGRSSFHKRVTKRKKGFPFGAFLMRVFLGFGLISGAEFGLFLVVSGVFQPQFSSDMVRSLAEESRVLEGVNERMSFLQKELWSLVDEEVSNCTFMEESEWTINQDTLLLNSRKVLYKSMAEEVSIWGWPLQTSGLLTAEFSPRSFTILSGRLTEWTNGEISSLVRESNSSSWVQGKWSASAVQLDPGTWILEYRRSLMMENARLVSAALQFLKFRLVREFKHMQKEFWLLFAFGNQFFSEVSRTRPSSYLVPT